MLSHRNRFHGHGSLRYLYQHGKKTRNRLFGITFIENKNRVHSRFAVTVSKKVFKSAVKRNRVRRRIYEIIRLDLENIQKPLDVSITVFSQDILTMTPENLKKELLSLLEKERLIS